MDPNLTLIVFKKISEFAVSLNDLFGKRQRTLALYNRLLQKIPVTNTEKICKVVDNFTEFCVKNREAITSTSFNHLESRRIVYSEKIYIDLEDIFSVADNETVKTIWSHLLTISAYVDPSSNAKQVLLSMTAEQKQDQDKSKEESFLSEMIEDVGKTITPNAVSGGNPMSMVTDMLSSGMLNNLIGKMEQGINSGQLDINKLMASVQGMIGSMNRP